MQSLDQLRPQLDTKELTAEDYKAVAEQWFANLQNAASAAFQGYSCCEWIIRTNVSLFLSSPKVFSLSWSSPNKRRQCKRYHAG